MAAFPRLTWSEGVRQYQVEYSALRHRQGTKEQIQSTLRTFRRFLVTGTRKLSEIGPQTFLGYIEWRLTSGVRLSTVNKQLRYLRSIFRWMELNELIEKDPFRRFRLPKEPKSQRVIPSHEEVNRFLSFLAGGKDLFYSDLIRLVLNTGLRIGETLWLRTEDVDLEGGSLKVVGTEEHQLKDGEDRIVPLNQIARQILSRWHRWALDRKYLFFDGKPITVRAVSLALARRCERAGIKMTWHSFRHVFASRAASVMPEISLAAILGHSDPSITRKWYIHRQLMTLPVPPAI